jgi:hypothetical protein
MKLINLKIYPKIRKSGKPPMLANKKESKLIIEHLERISSNYGTEIEYKDGIGYVKLN